MPHSNLPGSNKLPFLDLIVAEVVRKSLKWLLKRSDRRGDRHESAHIAAMILIGQSDHITSSRVFPNGFPCVLTELKPVMDVFNAERRDR